VSRRRRRCGGIGLFQQDRAAASGSIARSKILSSSLTCLSSAKRPDEKDSHARRPTHCTIARASPSALGGSPGASRPLIPSVSHSGIPPTENATAGNPRSPASGPTRPNGSGHVLGTISRSELRIVRPSMTWSRVPRNSMEILPGFDAATRLAIRSHAARSGPSPTKTSWNGLFSKGAAAATASNIIGPPFSRVILPA